MPSTALQRRRNASADFCSLSNGRSLSLGDFEIERRDIAVRPVLRRTQFHCHALRSRPQMPSGMNTMIRITARP